VIAKSDTQTKGQVVEVGLRA